MFHSITWQQYMIFISVVTFVYYLFVLLIFYRNELIFCLKGTKSDHIIQGGEENKISFNDLLDELKILFQLASKRKYPKEELMMALQLKLKEYSQFKDTPFEITVTNFIAEESDNQCSIHLSEEDQRVLWMG